MFFVVGFVMKILKGGFLAIGDFTFLFRFAWANKKI